MILRRTVSAFVLGSLLAVSAGCSDTESADTGGTTTTVSGGGQASTTTPSTDLVTQLYPLVDVPSACATDLTGDLGPVTVVEGVASDFTVTSFDGTEIRAHWFPTTASASAAPTVLMGPGWSLGGETSMEGSPIFGSLGIGRLLESGYNVLTWDPRGFGVSGGEVNVDSPAVEGRDVQVLLDWITTLEGVQLDSDGDPRVGMIGASYGGGIQLATAAIDCRIDAIVPNMAWNSLTTSLHRNGTFKQGWGTQLTTFAAAATLDEHITAAATEGTETGRLSEDNLAWFGARGPGELVERISIPTLLMGGTVDTLFTLDETIANFEALDRAGTEVSMLWYCGGHGVCLTTPNPDLTYMADATIAWLDRWVKGDESVDTGPKISLVDQSGNRYGADDTDGWGDEHVSVGVDTPFIPLMLEPTTQDEIMAPPGDILGNIVTGITPAPAHSAIELSIATDTTAFIAGAPALRFSYRGTAGTGDRPQRVFAQLVDPASGTVVGGQVTPIPVTLDGTDRVVRLSLESIAHRLDAGATLTLQIIATTPAYIQPQLGGQIEITSAELHLPIAGNLRPL